MTVSLGSGMATVDGRGGAVARLVGGEERDDGGDLGGLSEPEGRNPINHVWCFLVPVRLSRIFMIFTPGGVKGCNGLFH